jgi:hypothetical protein
MLEIKLFLKIIPFNFKENMILEITSIPILEFCFLKLLIYNSNPE